jgi:hypothetical protein
MWSALVNFVLARDRRALGRARRAIALRSGAGLVFHRHKDCFRFNHGQIQVHGLKQRDDHFNLHFETWPTIELELVARIKKYIGHLFMFTFLGLSSPSRLRSMYVRHIHAILVSMFCVFEHFPWLSGCSFYGCW